MLRSCHGGVKDGVFVGRRLTDNLVANPGDYFVTDGQKTSVADAAE